MNVRTVHNKKVVRLKIDIPFGSIKSRMIEGRELVSWLQQRVDNEISLRLTTLDEDDQEQL